jgi:hypothetical protein
LLFLCHPGKCQLNVVLATHREGRMPACLVSSGMLHREFVDLF